MALPLSGKTNVTAPNAAYPYGDIKDNTGSNNGTPVNKSVYADIHQFFAKLFDVSALTYNNLPDNFTNGFQYFQALQKFSGILASPKISTAWANIGSNPSLSANYPTSLKLMISYEGNKIVFSGWLKWSTPVTSAFKLYLVEDNTSSFPLASFFQAIKNISAFNRKIGVGTISNNLVESESTFPYQNTGIDIYYDHFTPNSTLVDTIVFSIPNVPSPMPNITMAEFIVAIPLY